MKKTIVVLGVTGVQGGSVASKYLNSPEWRVRGMTRNASSPSAVSLASQGVEIVQADLDNPSSLATIFHGAHAIFAVTDFWQPYFTAPKHINSDPSDKRKGEYAIGIELRRGKAIADYAAKVLAAEGILEHFIWSGLPDVKGSSRGKFEYVYHFDGKAEITRYIKESLPALYEKTSVLYMAFYIDNIIKYAGKSLGVTKSEDGTYFIPSNIGADIPHPFADPKDAAIFVDLLLGTAPGKILLGVGEYLSWTDFAKLWTEIVGQKMSCKEMSVGDWDHLIPGGFGKEYAESMAFSAEIGWGAGDAGKMLLPKDLNPNIKTTSAREYIEKENWEPVLSQ